MNVPISPVNVPGQQTQPGPADRINNPPESVAELVASMSAWIKQLERITAAYDHLHDAYLSHNNQLPASERRRGLPLLEIKGSLPGMNSIPCVLDLKDLNPAHVNHVLAPLIFMQYQKIGETLEEIAAIIDRLRVLVTVPPTVTS